MNAKDSSGYRDIIGSLMQAVAVVSLLLAGLFWLNHPQLFKPFDVLLKLEGVVLVLTLAALWVAGLQFQNSSFSFFVPGHRAPASEAQAARNWAWNLLEGARSEAFREHQLRISPHR